jgi:hypothetical protein
MAHFEQLSDGFGEASQKAATAPTIETLKTILGDTVSKDPAFSLENVENGAIRITAKKTGEHIRIWANRDGTFGIVYPGQDGMNILSLKDTASEINRFHDEHKAPAAAASQRSRYDGPK